MPNFLKPIFLLCCTLFVAISQAQSTSETTRSVELINLRKGVNQGYFARDRELPKLLFVAAKQAELPCYEVNYDMDGEKNIQVKKIEAEKLNQWDGISADQLSVLGIDYVKTATNTLQIQYIHLYAAAGYFSDNQEHYMISFRFEDVKKYLDTDHRSLWIEEDDALFENLAILDESVQAYLAQKLAKLVYQNQIKAYAPQNFEQEISQEEFSKLWNPLTDAPEGEIRVQVIDERIVKAGIAHHFFTSKYMLIWNTKSNQLKPIAVFNVEDVQNQFKQVFFQNQELYTYSDALAMGKFEKEKTLWQKVSHEPFYTYTFSTPNPVEKVSYFTRKEIDLTENVHQHFLQKGKELSRYIFKALEEGRLQAYNAYFEPKKGTFKEEKMSFEEVRTNLMKPTKEVPASEILGITEEQVEVGITLEQLAEVEKFRAAEQAKLAAVKNLYQNPSSLFFEMAAMSLLELEYEIVYDTQQKNYFYRSAYLSLYIPAEKSGIGIHKLVAKFRFQDVYQLLQKTPKVALNSLQQELIKYMNKNLSTKIPTKLNYASLFCNQVEVGNHWLVEGVFWE